MGDEKSRLRKMKDELLIEYADLMMNALRRDAALPLAGDDYYKLREKIVDALTGSLRI